MDLIRVSSSVLFYRGVLKMLILAIVITFLLLYLVIMTSMQLMALIEINDTITIIKNQVREIVTKDLLERLKSGKDQ